MFYDRKIKYLDYYENGAKVSGGGFVKLEVRDNALRLELTIRGLHPTDSFDREIILQGAEKEEVLGQIRIQNGSGQYRCSCDADRGIGGTGIPYGELRGIRISIGGTREILCQWGNTSNQRRIAQPEKSRQIAEAGRQEPQDAFREAPEKTSWDEPGKAFGETSGAGSEKAPWQEPGKALGEAYETEREKTSWERSKAGSKNAPEINPKENLEENHVKTLRKESGTKSSIDNKADSEGAVNIIREQTDKRKLEKTEPDDSKGEGSEGKGFRLESVEILTQSGLDGIQIQESTGQPKGNPATVKDDIDKQPAGQKVQVMLLEDKWQQLSALYPHIQPFHDERDYLSLTPSDFVLFPTRFYRAVNNSFLLHGYYNYHHLILARIERRGEVLYYIGVPGNYFEREKQVAIMFGFESFECEAEPAKTGDFGYYMMRTEL